MQKYAVIVCTKCGREWEVPSHRLMHPKSPWCTRCRGATGRIMESLLCEDTQPGPLADLFETVMLSAMLGRPSGAAGEILRTALGVDP